MHPSSLGRGVSGGQSSLDPQASNNTHGSNNHPRSPSGNVVQGGPQQSSRPDNTTANDLWYLTAQSGSVNDSKPIAAATSSSSSSMIGPTSTFYNPDENANQQQHTEQRQYQQWLDNYQDNQRQQSQQLGYEPYRQGAAPQLNAQNPYSFMQGTYRPSRPATIYTGSNAGTVTQAPGGSLVTSGKISSYQTQNDAYSPFYEALSLNPSLATTPEHYSTPEPANQSYTASPNPMYHQQQQPLYNQQHQQPNMTPNAEPNQSTSAQTGQFLRPQSAQYLQRNQSEQGSRVSSNLYPTAPSSHSLSPPVNVWGNETTYTGNQPLHHQFGLLDSQPGARRTAPSRTSAAPFGKRPAVNAAENLKSFNNNASGPAATTSAAPAAASSSQTSLKRKRVRKNDIPEGKISQQGYGGQDSDSDSYDDEDDGTGLGMTGGIGVGLGGLGVVGKGGKRDNRARLPGACTHCKKLKMKCDFPRHENTCQRCKSGGHVCIVEGRRPRTAPNKREYLLAQIRQKDTIIDSLLKQLHNPYIATPLSIASYRMATSPSDHNNQNVLAWLDRLQSSVRDAGKKSPGAFLDIRGANGNEEDSEGENENKQIRDQFSKAAVMKTEGNDEAGEGPLQDSEKPQSSLPESHVPLGLIAALSLSSSKASKKKDQSKDPKLDDDLNDDNVGVANETYFMPGPATDLGMRASLIEQHSAPEILVHGLVKPEDVEKLFQIFYERVNPFISLLDPVLHTPASTFARCPFLFTVICAISSRYYAEKSEIYPIAMHFAKHSAANALIDGWKSVELCQAYILMSIYAVPARRWEEDRSWLYTGLAIRIATDLNLHHVSTVKPTSEKQEREILNKTRVWMICFNLDRSTATQFGKPSTIKEDFIVRNAKDWYKKSQYNLSYDVHLCGYSALLQVVAKFHDEIFSDPSSPTGLNKKVDFRAITLAHNARLTEYYEEWDKRFKDDSDATDPGSTLRCSLLPFLVGYSRLVMFSFGFQQAYQRGFENEDSIFFTTCLEAAKSVIENMINGLAPSGYMRYAPDGHFVFASFASAFLLKLLRPEFSSFLEKEQENEIFDLIGRLIQTLSSPKIAIDDRHTPKLYARFLAGLLSRHRRDGATVGRLQTIPAVPHTIPPSSVPGQAAPSANTLGAGHYPSAQNGNGGSGGILSQGMEHQTMHQMPTETPVYMPEATFATSTGQIDFGADYDMTYGASEFSDQEMLATMQAIKNPAWWQNMMMPGFSWPEASPSPPANPRNYPANMVNSSYLSNLGPSATGFGMFHGAEVMM